MTPLDYEGDTLYIFMSHLFFLSMISRLRYYGHIVWYYDTYCRRPLESHFVAYDDPIHRPLASPFISHWRHPSSPIGVTLHIFQSHFFFLSVISRLRYYGHNTIIYWITMCDTIRLHVWYPLITSMTPIGVTLRHFVGHFSFCQSFLPWPSITGWRQQVVKPGRS